MLQNWQNFPTLDWTEFDTSVFSSVKNGFTAPPPNTNITGLPIFPSDNFSLGSKFLATLGSFWSDNFPDNDILETLYSACSIEQLQTVLTTDECVKATDKQTCPLFQRKLWYKFSIS